MDISRRHFMQGTAAFAGAALLAGAAPQTTPAPDIRGGIVLCNHWTQYGIGETFPEGEIRGRWYRRNFSTVFGLEQGLRWLEQASGNRVCHEFDAYFLEALAEEDPGYIEVIRGLLDSKRMELPGGTFGQAESQVFGYESAIRQLTFGQAAYRRHLGRAVDTFIVEEQNFFAQLPQLLKLAGFRYASMQFQNSGTPKALPYDLIAWESPDGTTIPAVPNHPGMLSCARQWKSYEEVAEKLAGRKAPLLYQWMELWPPGLDWGASIAPYQEAVHGLEGKGYRQMLLTEYIQWALERCDTPRVRIPMDDSNYNNNFFQGGWGYENERTARGSNRCESLLLALETLCAGGNGGPVAQQAGNRLQDLWTRLLISQNHDPYLAGSVPAYVDGLRSFQSELAVKQLAQVKRVLREEAGLDAPLAREDKAFRLFNPCPWAVATPVLFELEESVWPAHAFRLKEESSEHVLNAVARSDNGNVLMGPVLVRLGPYGTLDAQWEPAAEALAAVQTAAPRLTPKQDGRVWESAGEAFAGIEFEPLVGEWRQAPSYFTSPHPNTNVEVAYNRIEDAPVALPYRGASGGMAVATWRRDLMRIRETPEPALSVQGLVFGGEDPAPFLQFNHRLTGTIRFETGARPNGTWRFRVRIPATQPRIVADAPYSEEQRNTEFFYCSRYIRIEWPGRHLLWCPSQNTLFRRIDEGKSTVIECTVFDFSFTGTAQWEMRFHAGASFTPAHSMRLAETFHRRPVRVPANVSGGSVEGVGIDNEQVLITHVFAADGAAALRAVNASDLAQTATIRWPGTFVSVHAADLEGKLLSGDSAPMATAQDTWEYAFRPWEIATFRVLPQ